MQLKHSFFWMLAFLLILSVKHTYAVSTVASPAGEKMEMVRPYVPSQKEETAFSKCGFKTPDQDTEKIYQGIKRIVLLTEIFPIGYFSVPECSGKEKICAEKDVTLENDAPAKKAYVKKLVKYNKEYPKALYPEKIEQRFGERIKKALFYFIVPDQNCKRPELSVSRIVAVTDEVKTAMSEADTLTVHIRVTVVTSEKPKIAVINTYMSRPGAGSMFPLGGTMAFSLDLPENEIEDRVQKFADRFLVWLR